VSAVVGYHKFIAFCISFHAFLVDQELYPLLSTAAWHFHSLWFERLRTKVRPALLVNLGAIETAMISKNRGDELKRVRGEVEVVQQGIRERQRIVEELVSRRFRRATEVFDPNVCWDFSMNRNSLGDKLRDLGDLAGAMTAYRESLDVRRRFAKSDPKWRRGLSVGLNRIGDVLIAQGDLYEASETYKESLEVIRRLAVSDPSDANLQRDLSVSQERMGESLRAQGDLAGALTVCREALEVRRRLVASEPSNTDWQRDLSFSLTQIAQILVEQGNHVEAIGLAEEGLMIDEHLTSLDPDNVTWQSDATVSRSLVNRLRPAKGTRRTLFATTEVSRQAAQEQ
jgi:tetratricopeptide (TPR) repeat protein